MEREEIEEIVAMALGEASALFMSQGDTTANEMIMPTEELIRITNEAVTKLSIT